MFGLVIAVHVIACALLILIVLIQQGRGGGLIDSLSSAENILGTKTSTFLVKATSILAVIFFFTCLSLAFLSIRKGKSLIETSYRPVATAPVAATATAQNTAAVEKETAPKTTAAQAATTSKPAEAPASVPAVTPNPATPTTTTSPQSAPTQTANVETKK
jgi:preprotein translocase subunit SecG